MFLLAAVTAAIGVLDIQEQDISQRGNVIQEARKSCLLSVLSCDADI